MVKARVYTHLLPALVEPSALIGGQVVVIDVLRASTTICAALAAGAAGVRIAGEVEEARRVARELGAGVVLGGERGGARIEGFDLGNSPDEYTGSAVGGKMVVFTTTNGTRAALHAREAGRIVVGCLANARAAAGALGADGRAVHLLCAGTEGEVSLEDALGAGAIADVLMGAGLAAGNDQTIVARELFLAVDAAGGRGIATLLRAGKGGRNVARLGLERDIGRCAERDWCAVVPELDVNTMTFRPARP